MSTTPVVIARASRIWGDTSTHFFAPQAGVAMASASDLSFNWTGFITAMISNLTFGFRAVLSKK